MRGRGVFLAVAKATARKSGYWRAALRLPIAPAPPAAAVLSFLEAQRPLRGAAIVGRRLRRALPRAAAPSGGRAPSLRLICAPLDCPSGNLRTKGCSAEQPFFIHSATLGGMAAVAC